MTNKSFGSVIAKLIRKEDLAKQETAECFRAIIQNEQSEMQQGAFLAALAAKGETVEEIVEAWQAIYELDTVKVSINTSRPIVENCGTGMDAIKTFNISTAASIIAAADDIPIARHGARAITSSCGTVDLVEELGINVECPPEAVKKSIEEVGIGLFNGMSSLIHPTALGRILSQISFGSVLNIAASLANPAMPRIAVRGVYSRDLLVPTAEIMQEIGYTRALVVYGYSEHLITGGIDEASTMGPSQICELLDDGTLIQYTIKPQEFGIKPASPMELAGGDKTVEAERMWKLLAGQETQARMDIACLNAGLILYAAGSQPTIDAGFTRACELLTTDKPVNKLKAWIGAAK